MKSPRVVSGLDLKYMVQTHYRTPEVSHSRSSTRTAAAPMSVLDGAGTVHSMLSHELSECVVMFQQVHGVASTQVMKPCAISALKALALDDAKHRETHPARSRLAPSAARSCQGTTARRAAATRSAIT